MSECAYLTYYQRNRDVILNRAKGYYESDKERLKEQARDNYRNLSEKEKKEKERIHFPKIHRSVLHKLTADLLYF